jgi:hypothetical protein
MKFTDWMIVLGMKKNNEVKVEKIKEQSIDMEAMASGSPFEVTSALLARLLEQRNASTKVLMVQNGEYIDAVSNYTLKMAQRLDCEIIALDVTDKPLQFTGDRKTRETAHFLDMAGDNAEHFTRQAMAMGIKVNHIMQVGIPEEVIARVRAADAGIRYILSKPEDEPIVEPQRDQVPVLGLHRLRL